MEDWVAAPSAAHNDQTICNMAATPLHNEPCIFQIDNIKDILDLLPNFLLPANVPVSFCA